MSKQGPFGLTVSMRLWAHVIRRRKAGVTLIELLCVCAIIMILVSMLVPSVLKALKRAKAFEVELQGNSFTGDIARALSTFCDGVQEFPALTPAQLGELGVFDGNILKYLRKPEVRYYPFSSKDPPEKIILHVDQGEKSSYIIYKRDVMRGAFP